MCGSSSGSYSFGEFQGSICVCCPPILIVLAGLGFLGVGSYAFAPILFAQGAVLAGLIANRIFYQGQNLLSFKLNILAFVVVFLVSVLAPLLVFAPQLNAAKRRGLGEYGTRAASYVREFEEKWLPAGEQKTNAHQDELLGEAATSNHWLTWATVLGSYGICV